MTATRRVALGALGAIACAGVGAAIASGTTGALWRSTAEDAYQGTPPTTSPAPSNDWSASPRIERAFLHPSASRTGFAPGAKNYYTGAVLCAANSKDTCASGRNIVTLAATKRGTLVAGYGEWSLNVDSFGTEEGRPAIRELDPAASTWTDPIAVGSEAMDLVYAAPDGATLIPTTDPGDKAGTGQSSGNISGFWTDESGAWELVPIPGQEHVMGAYRTREGATYISGAANERGTLWRADPGSRDFKLAFESEESGGQVRVMWISGDGKGTVYFGLTGGGTHGVYAYDESTGATTRPGGKLNAGAVAPALAVDFDGGFQFCPKQSRDWVSASGAELFGNADFSFGSMTGDGQSLYVVTTEAFVWQLDRGQTKARNVAEVPWDAACIAAVGSDIYVGGPGGQIGLVKRLAP